MPQITLLIDTLKLELRKQGITYKKVGEVLSLSEASVKRLFSEKSFTLPRLGQVCDLLGLELSDLIYLMEKNIDLITQLTLDQERELVADIKLLLMAHFLMSKLEFKDIIQTYDISEAEGIRLLAKLDRMRIIELLPGNRVKLLFSNKFKLISNGPIQNFYEEKVQSEFFNSSFSGAGEYRIFVSGMLSRSANAEIIKKIKHLADDANELKLESKGLALKEQFGTSLVMAIRPWEPKLFNQLRRTENVKKF